MTHASLPLMGWRNESFVFHIKGCVGDLFSNKKYCSFSQKPLKLRRVFTQILAMLMEPLEPTLSKLSQGNAISINARKHCLVKAQITTS